MTGWKVGNFEGLAVTKGPNDGCALGATVCCRFQRSIAPAESVKSLRRFGSVQNRLDSVQFGYESVRFGSNSVRFGFDTIRFGSVSVRFRFGLGFNSFRFGSFQFGFCSVRICFCSDPIFISCAETRMDTRGTKALKGTLSPISV